MTTSTVIAALKSLPQQALFSPAVRMCLADVTELQVDQTIHFDRDGFPAKVIYTTGRGQGLLADCTEVNGSARVLPPDDFTTLPSCVPAYSLLTLDTAYRHLPALPSVIDLHAWLVARITDLLELHGVPWVWTSTGSGSTYCDWRDDLYPASPLGDAFAWQASLEQEVG